MKRLIVILLLVLALLTAGYTSITSANPPGCQSMCLDASATFVMQCYQSTGDSSACTTAGALLYENCMLNNCPGRSPR